MRGVRGERGEYGEPHVAPALDAGEGMVIFYNQVIGQKQSEPNG